MTSLVFTSCDGVNDIYSVESDKLHCDLINDLIWASEISCENLKLLTANRACFSTFDYELALGIFYSGMYCLAFSNDAYDRC